LLNDILVDQKPREAKIPPMARRFRLALKVQTSNVRTDTDRAAGLMKDTRNVREVSVAWTTERILPKLR
jgi:hypothetical protein